MITRDRKQANPPNGVGFQSLVGDQQGKFPSAYLGIEKGIHVRRFENPGYASREAFGLKVPLLTVANVERRA